MACATLGWSWSDLADAAEVWRDTIARFLRGEELKAPTIDATQAAPEAAGIEFIAEGQASDTGGPGARLAKRKRVRKS